MAIFTWELRVPSLYLLLGECRILVCNRGDKRRQLGQHSVLCRHFSAGFVHTRRRQHYPIALKPLRLDAIKVALSRRPNAVILNCGTSQTLHLSVAKYQGKIRREIFRLRHNLKTVSLVGWNDKVSFTVTLRQVVFWRVRRRGEGKFFPNVIVLYCRIVKILGEAFYDDFLGRRRWLHWLRAAKSLVEKHIVTQSVIRKNVQVIRKRTATIQSTHFLFPIWNLHAWLFT